MSVATIASCKTDLPIDNINDNPGIPGPKGIIEGTVSYYGPPPCFKDGQVEGAMVVLLFDFNNPPPPDGLATTALNFQTVPGERLFASLPHPTGNQPGAKGHGEFCAPIGSTPITATSSFTMSEIDAGQYQVRAFYSQRNTFFPLYDIRQLPVAGDVQGGAVVDPNAAKPSFIPINIGVPKSATDPTLVMPDDGFISRDVPVVVGQLLQTNRPYFYVDYGPLSRSFNNPKAPVKGETGVVYPTDDAADSTTVGLEFPQDHAITAQQNLACAASPDPNCDIFQFAQASLPSVHFFYGFPGKSGDPSATPPDAWLSINAKPSSAFNGAPQPYYSIDPTQGVSPLSQGFILTRNFNPDGTPSVLVDNQALEQLAKIADLFPQVVLAKLQEDDYGVPTYPLTPQADPIVVIQGFTVRKNSMKATAEGDVTGGGLSTIGDPSQTNPLHTATGFEQYTDFSAEIRPAALCIRPQPNDLRGVLVAPFETDPNPNNTTDKQLVNSARIVEVQAARVRGVEFGCIPPGWYTINVIYPSGQAWTTPNTMGECSFTLQGQPAESCSTPPMSLPAQVVSAGFDTRPLLQSQEIYKTDAAGKIVAVDDKGQPCNYVDQNGANNGTCQPVPMIMHVLPSARCMQAKTDASGRTVLVTNPTHEDTNHNGILDPGEDTNGDGILEFSVPQVCRVLKNAGDACVDPIQCASGKCTNGVCG